MQTVAGVGLPLGAPAAEYASEAACAGQGAGGGLASQSAQEQSIFVKLFVQSIRAGQPAAGVRAEGEELPGEEGLREDGTQADPTVMDWLLTYLFAAQPAQNQSPSGAQSPDLPGISAASCIRAQGETSALSVPGQDSPAPPQSAGEAEAVFAAIPDGQPPDAALSPQRSAGEGNAASPTPQGGGEPAAASVGQTPEQALPVTQGGGEPAAPQNSQAPDGLPPAAEVSAQAAAQTPGRPPAAPARSRAGEDGPSRQAENPGGDPAESAAAPRDTVAVRIVKTLRSMGAYEQPGQFSGAPAPREEAPAPRARASSGEEATLAAVSVPSDGSPPPPEKVSAVEKAWDRFLNDYRAAETGPSEIRVVLEPEDLGELTILVSRTEGGISAKIRSEDRQLCAVMTDQLQKLVQSMESRGIAVRDVDVELSQAGQSFSFARHQSGGGDGRPRSDTPRPRISAQGAQGTQSAGFFGLWQTPSDGNNTSGTMEYRI